ncbi:hypothetical protein [Pseudomonas syringae]|uniref:hypothetical protein n=1 Tax=Pseudomonas syringae TaxID=317 RepID=UPI00073F152D|nr:hypothetical protein [Pseudomonas syringae]
MINYRWALRFDLLILLYIIILITSFNTMKNSTLIFYSSFIMIASAGFLGSVAYLIPDAFTRADLTFLFALQGFAIFLLFKMNEAAKKEKQQQNNNNGETL